MDDKAVAEMYKRQYDELVELLLQNQKAEMRGEVRYAIDLISLGVVLLFAVEVVLFLFVM